MADLTDARGRLKRPGKTSPPVQVNVPDTSFQGFMAEAMVDAMSRSFSHLMDEHMQMIAQLAAQMQQTAQAMEKAAEAIASGTAFEVTMPEVKVPDIKMPAMPGTSSGSGDFEFQFHRDEFNDIVGASIKRRGRLNG